MLPLPPEAGQGEGENPRSVRSRAAQHMLSRKSGEAARTPRPHPSSASHRPRSTQYAPASSPRHLGSVGTKTTSPRALRLCEVRKRQSRTGLIVPVRDQ